MIAGEHALCDPETDHRLTISVVYVDAHLIELEASLNAGCWRGRATAYTVSESVAEFAVRLEQFAIGVVPIAELEAGANTGIGLIALRFYRIDRSGHIACHVRLARKVDTSHRPEQLWTLAVEVRAESWGIGRFAGQLAKIAATQWGQAELAIKPLA